MTEGPSLWVSESLWRAAKSKLSGRPSNPVQTPGALAEMKNHGVGSGLQLPPRLQH